jgi:hypothetical protein
VNFFAPRISKQPREIDKLMTDRGAEWTIEVIRERKGEAKKKAARLSTLP